jgi:large subunit ribosomal protein L15
MLDQLKPSPGSRHRRKRLGRGPGSGIGRYCGSGIKGQGTRSGGAVRLRFEGGQMPITMRLPKRGFTSRNRVGVEIVNLADLAKLGDGATVDAATLSANGLIRGSGAPIKLLGEGEALAKLTIKVNRISASARSKVEAAGGSVELVS